MVQLKNKISHKYENKNTFKQGHYVRTNPYKFIGSTPKFIGSTSNRLPCILYRSSTELKFITSCDLNPLIITWKN